MSEETTPRRNTVIESLGVYLPPKEVQTNEVLRGCRKKIRFPLEQMSGIKSRRVAGETEFSIDLAKQAIARCFAASRYQPGDIDLVISASIARCDGPGVISYEPSTSLRLKRHFAFDNAVAFDVASACSGMFTAIHIVDALIQLGAIGCGLVVSGEYISHLGETAQKEIEGVLDSRLACLTLGDAGAAIILDAASRPGIGFDVIELCTFGEHANYCIARPTEQEHGGGIMFTDALKLTDAATRHGAVHALQTLREAGWSPDAFEHLIMHQTSSTSMASAMREINRLMKRPACHTGNTIDNLAHRGNTATTSHFVALADHIENGRIQSGDRVIFAVSGSGLTVGTALYTFDDLPDRMRAAGEPEITPVAGVARKPPPAPSARPTVRVESVGTAPRTPATTDSLALLRLAATDCLERSSHDRRDVGLLIYAGTYRSEFVGEPAIATLLAGGMDINATAASPEGQKTLAFDVFNGAVGFLNACHVATEMIRAKKAATALVVAAEVENNAGRFPDDLLGIEETGSAVLLDESPGDGSGFGRFLFRSFTEHAGAFTSHCINKDGKAYLRHERDPDLEQLYIDAIVSTVAELLKAEGLEMWQISAILPPQMSSAFIARLARAMDVAPGRFVDAVQDQRDLFTSSIPLALRRARDQDAASPGDIGLIISAGSGIQIGCALYYF